MAAERAGRRCTRAGDAHARRPRPLGRPAARCLSRAARSAAHTRARRGGKSGLAPAVGSQIGPLASFLGRPVRRQRRFAEGACCVRWRQQFAKAADLGVAQPGGPSSEASHTAEARAAGMRRRRRAGALRLLQVERWSRRRRRRAWALRLLQAEQALLLLLLSSRCLHFECFCPVAMNSAQFLIFYMGHLFQVERGSSGGF